MTPTAPELLMGCVASISNPPAAEDGAAFQAGKFGLVAIIDFFCAQECQDGSAIRVWENALLKDLLTEAGDAYDAAMNGALRSAKDIEDGDFSLKALDEANAELRRRLCRLHELAEVAEDRKTDLKILAAYRLLAARRELKLPSGAPS